MVRRSRADSSRGWRRGTRRCAHRRRSYGRTTDLQHVHVVPGIFTPRNSVEPLRAAFRPGRGREVFAGQFFKEGRKPDITGGPSGAAGLPYPSAR